MPYIPFAPVQPGVFLGMWKVEEGESYFLSRLNIYENEEKRLEGIKHPAKRLEWLSSRLCLKKLLHISHRVESLNMATGQPYLSDRSFNISYSHSNLYSGAIASSIAEVSMDLEDLTKKRNPETRFLFMHPEELEYYEASGQNINLFFLIWSSKETLYKIYNKKGIAFKENLQLYPESMDLGSEGIIKGIIQANGVTKEYKIHYRFFPDVLLTYTYDLHDFL